MFVLLSFIFSCIFKVCPAVILVSIITNSCTHSTIFIKNTLKAHVKFTPTPFRTQMDARFKHEVLL